jgi:hypothetical protein
MARDYIPREDVMFLEWAKIFVPYVNNNMMTWNIPSQEFMPIPTLLTNFEMLFAISENPNRGHVDVLKKDEARAALEKAVRAFVKSYLVYNPFVSDADRKSMGVPIHKTTHTRILPPTTFPDAEVDLSVPRQFAIHYRDHDSLVRAKPEGVHGAEVRWAILDEPPTSVDELINSSFSTQSPFIMTFDESQRGKRVYFCLRWENPRGEKGPWSEIYSAIIP